MNYRRTTTSTAIPRVTQLANRIGKVPDPAAFEVPRAENASGSEQEEAELPPNSVWRKFSDDATNPIIKAADMRGFFLSEALLWRYEDDFSLQERTDFLYAEAKKAGPPIGSDPAKAAELSRKALRLEGIKTRKQAERLEKKKKIQIEMRRDVFPQVGLREFNVTDKKGRVKPKCAVTKSTFRFE